MSKKTETERIHIPDIPRIVADAARGGVRTQGITLRAPKRYQVAISHTRLTEEAEWTCRPTMQVTAYRTSHTHNIAHIL
jgi:hypothetical protein